MENSLANILKNIFGELNPPKQYNKVGTLVINGEKYMMGCWQERDLYYIVCEKIGKIMIEDNETKAFEKMEDYILNQTIRKNFK